MRSTLELLAVPDPGQGTEPPGAAALVTVMGWIAWGALALCVVGVIITGGAMAVASRRGGGAGEHATQLGFCLIGAIVAGSAASIVTFVL